MERPVTVLIAAAGDPGEAAQRALADRDVRRVETLANAHEVLGDSTVVVVGDLVEGSPADIRGAARDAGVPTVRLDEEDEGYVATADPDDIGAIRNAVELAECVAEYRAAVDELYERCRAHAEGDLEADEEDLQAAQDRAHRFLRELRERTGRVPYETLLSHDGGAKTDEESGDGDRIADRAEAEDNDSGDEGAIDE